MKDAKTSFKCVSCSTCFGSVSLLVISGRVVDVEVLPFIYIYIYDTSVFSNRVMICALPFLGSRLVKVAALSRRHHI